MSESKKIPVRVKQREEGRSDLTSGEVGRPAHGRGAGNSTLPAGNRAEDSSVQRRSYAREGELDAAPGPGKADEGAPAAAPGGEVDWRDRAQRLQAEMENYRRRQKRLAQADIQAERERLLTAFLEVVDDLERALASPSRDGGGLREGVELTYRAALQKLAREGVERIEARGQQFDPTWHEAVSTVPGRRMGAAPDTVVQVLEPGYRLGGRLLRPAKVLVAV